VNQLVAVDLDSGHVLKRLRMPAGPENVAVCGNTAFVVSPRARAVTLIDAVRLKVRRVLRGFGAPHIVACSPNGGYAYVTDDARGQLVAIRNRLVRKLFVGYGAHHIATSPDQPRLWIALGERARAIVVVDTTDPAHPRVIDRVDPHGLAHDVVFSTSGRTVWVTSDTAPTVRIFDAFTQRPVRAVYGGAPPQHVAFDPYSKGRHAYVTSGDDGMLRVISLRTGHTVRLVRVPPGSFNVTTFGSFVVTSSLTNGTLTKLTDSGSVVLSERVAPAARDVAIDVL
jgi:DNA-binding beta-propeller fold protein YncE